ncbi:MAG: IS66 family transposase [Methylococcales bacterium]
MSFGYQVYRQFFNRLRCWAHLLRKARGLAESLHQPTRNCGNRSLDLLHTLMKAVQDAREKPPDQVLSERYRQPLDDYRRVCEPVKASAPTQKAHQFAVEMLNDWEAIFILLDHPHLPLTNHQAERALRHCVILRSISYATQTPEGSRIFAILASVIETCRWRGHSPWRYLASVSAAGPAGSPVPTLPVST